MNKKQLLLLTPGFAANESDSACIPALQLYVRELMSRGIFEIKIVAFHYPYKPKEYNWYNAKVIALGGNNKQGLQRLINLRKAFRVAKALHLKNSIDYVQSFWLGECAWLGQKIANQFSITHFCTLMGQDALKINWRMKRQKKLPILIVLSNFHQQKLTENTTLIPDYIIPWGIEKKATEISNLRSIDVLGVGNLTSLKNFKRFVEIVLGLKERFPTIKAEIIGVGSQEKKLNDLIGKLQLSTNISMGGKLDRKLVLDKMAQSKCLLHCSQYESFGMVIPEALSNGTHVFSTAVGIAPEVDSVNVFTSNMDAVQQISEFLQSNPNYTQETPFLISETVNSYLNNVFLNKIKA